MINSFQIIFYLAITISTGSCDVVSIKMINFQFFHGFIAQVGAVLGKIFPGANCNDYCFNKTFPVFDGPLNKQLVIAPMSACAMNVSFLLFTPKNPNASQNFTYISPTSDWNSSNLDVSAKTQFIVHGWMDSYGVGGWMEVQYKLSKYMCLKQNNLNFRK